MSEHGLAATAGREPDDEPEVLTTTAGAVRIITLNRPAKLNPWSGSMGMQYVRHLDAADADSQVRAIVVTGAGRGFCAGGDLAMKSRAAMATQTQELKIDPSEAAVHAINVRKPVIAAVNGPCAGVGLTVALACDIRFIARDAKLTSAFARRGLVGTPGLPWLLARLTGPATALDILLSGRLLTASEAHGLGLGTLAREGRSAMDEAIAYAEDVSANCAPRSMAVLKRLLYDSLSTDFATSVAKGSPYMHQAKTWPEAFEGLESHLEKRPPKFPALTSEPLIR